MHIPSQHPPAKYMARLMTHTTADGHRTYAHHTATTHNTNCKLAMISQNSHSNHVCMYLFVSVDARNPAGTRHLMANGRSSDSSSTDTVFPNVLQPQR